ncbi:MAG: hypothetical protein IJ629_07465 [Clostridia bacterium]|nr:hypothetical protein [Clostridia bacterium]
MKKKVSIAIIAILFLIIISLFLTNKANAKVEPELKKLALAENQSSTIKADDKLYLDLDFGVTKEDVELFFPSISIRNIENKTESAIVYISDVWENPYVKFTNMSNKLKAGKYYISDLFMDNKHYSNYSTGPDVLPLDFNVEFTLVDDAIEGNGPVNQIDSVLDGIDITTTEAKRNERVYVALNGLSNSIDQVKGYIGGAGQYITVPFYDIHTNPYFIMPSNVIAGEEYGMGVIELIYSDGTKKTLGMQQLSNGNIKVKVKESAVIVSIRLVGNTEVTSEDTLNFDLKTSQEIIFASMIIREKNNEYGQGYYLSITEEDQQVEISEIARLAIDSTIHPGDYYISDIYLWQNGANGNSSECVAHYSKNPVDEAEKYLQFDLEFTIKSTTNQENSENQASLSPITLKSETAKINDKVYVDLNSNEKYSQVMLSFTNNEADHTMIVYLKDLNTNPYFIVPFTTVKGTYDLKYMIFKNQDGEKVHYRKDGELEGIRHFDFDCTIKIEKEKSDSGLLVLENDKITNDIIQKIAEQEENIFIEIYAENNPVIDSSVFEAIKGANKTISIIYYNVEWIFNGRNIVEAKTIDVSVSISYLANELDNVSNDGIMIDFANNGNLPGKCLIRIKSDDLKILDNKNTNVYYFNEMENNFNKVAMQIIASGDGYYEFYINHNSKYIMTLGEINPEYVSSDMSDLELNSSTPSETTSLNSATYSSTTASTDDTNEESKISKKMVLVILMVFVIVCTILVVAIETRKQDKKSEK